jgi:Zinc carboxypeptidase
MHRPFFHCRVFAQYLFVLLLYTQQRQQLTVAKIVTSYPGTKEAIKREQSTLLLGKKRRPVSSLLTDNRIPWIPGPHPHRFFNTTTRTRFPKQQQSLVSNRRSRKTIEEEQQGKQQQANVEQYVLWKPDEIADTVTKWADHYSNMLRVTTSQEAYGLPTAGSTKDCAYDTNVIGCVNYILIIQDYIAHPEHSVSSKRLPEVLWSGELHGDERVGPTAVLEATQLLLDSASCEALPRLALKTSNSKEEWDIEMQHAYECRQDLANRGINDTHRKWLARLLTTRRLVVIPTANALGYYQNRRTENNIDPNRDFPYDQMDPTQCMQTIAGRTINEVFREHLFQLSLTFHGGMEVIGYEWGAPSYSNKKSPDDIAQNAIANAYSKYAGKFGTTPAYDFGPYVNTSFLC